MLNKLWPIFIIVSVSFALIYGNIQNVNNAIFTSTSDAVQLSIMLLSTISLWSGITKILENTSLVNKLTLILQPIVNFLFPEMKKEINIKQKISMNIISNMLGLGNAATPVGISAMKSMQEKNKNKDEISNSMAMFIVINTASIQIIPTTVIAVRNSLGSTNPTKIIISVWIATICSALTGIFLTKIFIKINKKNQKINK